MIKNRTFYESTKATAGVLTSKKFGSYHIVIQTITITGNSKHTEAGNRGSSRQEAGGGAYMV